MGLLGLSMQTNIRFLSYYRLIVGWCGGTIVGSNTVLTAATGVCRQVERRWAFPSEIFVLQGNFSTPDYWNDTQYPCDYYETHGQYEPLFHGGEGPYNIAVIK